MVPGSLSNKSKGFNQSDFKMDHQATDCSVVVNALYNGSILPQFCLHTSVFVYKRLSFKRSLIRRTYCFLSLMRCNSFLAIRELHLVRLDLYLVMQN